MTTVRWSSLILSVVLLSCSSPNAPDAGPGGGDAGLPPDGGGLLPDGGPSPDGGHVPVPTPPDTGACAYPVPWGDLDAGWDGDAGICNDSSDCGACCRQRLPNAYAGYQTMLINRMCTQGLKSCLQECVSGQFTLAAASRCNTALFNTLTQDTPQEPFLQCEAACAQVHPPADPSTLLPASLTCGAPGAACTCNKDCCSRSCVDQKCVDPALGPLVDAESSCRASADCAGCCRQQFTDDARRYDSQGAQTFCGRRGGEPYDCVPADCLAGTGPSTSACQTLASRFDITGNYYAACAKSCGSATVPYRCDAPGSGCTGASSTDTCCWGCGDAGTCLPRHCARSTIACSSGSECCSGLCDAGHCDCLLGYPGVVCHFDRECCFGGCSVNDGGAGYCTCKYTGQSCAPDDQGHPNTACCPTTSSGICANGICCLPVGSPSTDPRICCSGQLNDAGTTCCGCACKGLVDDSRGGCCAADWTVDPAGVTCCSANPTHAVATPVAVVDRNGICCPGYLDANQVCQRCATHAQCGPGKWCDGTGVCRVGYTDGSPCEADAGFYCASGQCNDGHCGCLGKTCATSTDCCSTAQCAGGKCCLPNGLYCTGGAGNCCSGYCSFVPGGTATCAQPPPCSTSGGSCGSNGMSCCAGLVCQYGACHAPCTAVSGATCRTSLDCCAPLGCVNGTCAVPPAPCSPNGQPCAGNSDCCSGDCFTYPNGSKLCVQANTMPTQPVSCVGAGYQVPNDNTCTSTCCAQTCTCNSGSSTCTCGAPTSGSIAGVPGSGCPDYSSCISISAMSWPYCSNGIQATRIQNTCNHPVYGEWCGNFATGGCGGCGSYELAPGDYTTFEFCDTNGSLLYWGTDPGIVNGTWCPSTIGTQCGG